MRKILALLLIAWLGAITAGILSGFIHTSSASGRDQYKQQIVPTAAVKEQIQANFFYRARAKLNLAQTENQKLNKQNASLSRRVIHEQKHSRALHKALRQTKEALKKAKQPPFSLVSLGLRLQSWGYDVSEHPSFGGVAPAPRHDPQGCHYKSAAIDVNWNPAYQEVTKLTALYRWLRSLNSPHLTEIFWLIPGHTDHLHVSWDCITF